MTESRPSGDDEQADAGVTAERDRLATLLKQLARRIERAPLDRLTEALPSLAGPADELAGAVDGLLGPFGDDDDTPGTGPDRCC